MKSGNKKQLFSFLVLALPLIVSGCIGQGGEEESNVEFSQTDGVVIKSFNSDISEIEEDTNFALQLHARNIGGSEATDVWAHVFGQKWDVQSSVTSSDNGLTPVWQEIGTLEAPDRTIGIPGGEDFFDLTLTAPSIITDSTSYTWRTRVYSKYATEGGASIGLMSIEEARRQRETQGISQESVTSFNSGGPVQVEFRTQQPFVIRDDDEKEPVPVVLEINNVGGGTVFDPTKSSDEYGSLEFSDRNKVHVRFQGSSDFSCPGDTVGDAVEVTLRDQSTTLRCTLNVLKADIAPQSDLPVEVQLDYGYYVEDSTSVTVTSGFGS